MLHPGCFCLCENTDSQQMENFPIQLQKNTKNPWSSFFFPPASLHESSWLMLRNQDCISGRKTVLADFTKLCNQTWTIKSYFPLTIKKIAGKHTLKKKVSRLHIGSQRIPSCFDKGMIKADPFTSWCTSIRRNLASLFYMGKRAASSQS